MKTIILPEFQDRIHLDTFFENIDLDAVLIGFERPAGSYPSWLPNSELTRYIVRKTCFDSTPLSWEYIHPSEECRSNPVKLQMSLREQVRVWLSRKYKVVYFSRDEYQDYLRWLSDETPRN